MVENSLVVKANELIEARYDLSLNEQKIILYAVSKLDRTKEDFHVIELEVKDFTNLIDTSPKRYSEIRGIVRELRKKEVIIDTSERELITGWLNSIEYIKDSGKIKLKFSRDLMPYLLQLQERFTRYELKNVLYLKSKHSVRIFELLKQYEKIGVREFELEDLKKKLGCKGKYEDFRNFKRFVLDTAKEELMNNADIYFEYDKIMKGRKVIGIKFIVKSQKNKEIEFIDQIYSKEQIEEIKKQSGLKDMNISSKQLIELYEIAVKKTDNKNISPYRYICDNYIYTLEKTPKNQFSYLKKALEEDYANSLLQNFLKQTYSI